MFDVIAFDADDTLWHNGPIFIEARKQFSQFLTPYHTAEWIEKRLNETEIRNIERYGYGVKGFTLSMIETAIELTEGRISGAEIKRLIELSWEMLSTPLQLLDGVPETIAKLADSYPLMVITKGDLFDQESKVAASGLGEYFTSIEITSEKTRHAYEAILAKHKIAPHKFLMVGNSLRSDILPVLAAGGKAVYIPYDATWEHEMVPTFLSKKKEIIELENIRLLPDLIDQLARTFSVELNLHDTRR